MNKFYHGWAAVFGVALFAGAAHAQTQITGLSPSNVIGATDSYQGTYNTGSYNATLVLDTQSGTPTETVGSGPPYTTLQNGTFWLNNDNGPGDAAIVIDLGQAYSLSQIELFNTHNGQYGDRGTGNFTIQAGNAVVANPSDATAGMVLSGPTTYLIGSAGTPPTPATLAPALVADDAATGSIPGQIFNSSDTTDTFRYIQFDALSEANDPSHGPCCGANNYGLNEIKFFTGTPEPASLSLLGSGVFLLIGRRHRA